MENNSFNFINENSTGTDELPLLVSVIPGKNGTGRVFLIQIGDLFYEMNKKSQSKSGMQFSVVNRETVISKIIPVWVN
jgi:hypothetical protein